MRIVRSVLTTVVALAITVAVSACGASTPALTSPWPAADAERVVPKPPVPPRWPLTGLDAPSADAMTSRVICVKIENSAASKPQTGLDQADVVYESLAEGGITRFNAIFQSRKPAQTGPVRSARLSDSHIVPQYDGVLVYSGAAGYVTSRLRSAGVPLLDEDGAATSLERISGKKAPHNLYLDVTKVHADAAARGYKTTTALRSFTFDLSATLPTPTVSGITIPFSDSSKASWRWDPATRTYLRTDNGKPHTDAVTGKQLSARNVCVLWAKTSATGERDTHGSSTYDIALTGSGRATVFRDGAKFDCTWSAEKGAPPQFKTEDGSVVKLRPGNTWMQVIPISGTIAME